ncbi:hypothetical protein KsCSTR_46090 [Candidatus Kuenenia stuttgartiensis]|uniref:Uncharacterized protein n=1 Tax=Kuenenia stuttgartiensis TaxID=174633 RepID=Q1PWC8_KUEST|nr:hypothetical protein KsCSTR_46090 [Candidatus Kuenenia stuttgartiensis]CAJ71532.1 unknown protein [Candidatus Kuenenia stuttgartiensis]
MNGGGCCETTEYLPSFTPVKITFDLPVKNETVEGFGIIVRVRNGMYAGAKEKTYLASIHFYNIGADER